MKQRLALFLIELEGGLASLFYAIKKMFLSNPYFNAIRPRTLFLAVACSVCGSALAAFEGTFSVAVFALTLLTASLLQILSNLANDLGDFEKGTDTTGKRIGPVRALQSGAITLRRMKAMIIAFVVLTMVSGLTLLYVVSRYIALSDLLVLLVLGVCSIVASIKYTAGSSPYGYKGLGDLFSFIFFGPVAVVGTYFLHTHQVSFLPWLPALGIGLLTVAVLNINNMRDMQNDKASGKITIPIRIGYHNARFYHVGLTLGAMLCFFVFNILYVEHWYGYLYLLVFVLFIKYLADIFHIEDKRKLDPYLKLTAMTTFLLSVVFAIGINV